MLTKPKPRPIIPAPRPFPKPKRLPKRPHPMTLIAAFRCRNNGVLLCADREINDGISKREVEKIYHILLKECEVFIAGAGTSWDSITKAYAEIHESLHQADEKGADIIAEHRTLIESNLKAIYKRHTKDKYFEIGFIIVVAPLTPNSFPLLYRTQFEELVPKPLYAAHGNGQRIADYLSDRLYQFGIHKEMLGLLAAFIFREAEESSAGVGLGTDMRFIHEGENSVQSIPPNAVKEIDIPSLADAIYPYWTEHVKVPKWLKNPS
jgi:20S proteasome alpha/beta subunit